MYLSLETSSLPSSRDLRTLHLPGKICVESAFPVRPFRKPIQPQSFHLGFLAQGKAKKLALTDLMRKLIILANKLLREPDLSLAT